MTAPGIPNEFCLSTTCFGSRLENIQDQIFAAVGMGFRRIELGLAETPASMNGLDESRHETGVAIRSLVAGCRDPMNGEPVASRLGSTIAEERERALNSLRRHVRLAQTWGCPIVVVRGSKVDDPRLRLDAKALELRLVKEGASDELSEEIHRLAQRVQKGGQRQIEHLCRSLHTLLSEAPGIQFAIEPGRDVDDLLGYEAMGWVLDDLQTLGLGFWHDVGRLHMQERVGLPAQGQWLDSFGSRMVGIHLQDASDEEAEMPLGLGEVDFKLLAEYVPRNAERVLEINPRHGRAEILSSVHYLVDLGL